MAIPTEYSLILSIIILAIGLYGIFTRRSMIRILLGAELILGAATLNFITFAMAEAPGDITGHVMTLFTIAIAAADTIIGLILLIMLYKDIGSIDISLAKDAKGIDDETEKKEESKIEEDC